MSSADLTKRVVTVDINTVVIDYLKSKQSY